MCNTEKKVKKRGNQLKKERLKKKESVIKIQRRWRIVLAKRILQQKRFEFIYHTNGDLYYGEIKDALRNGIGYYKFANGDLYYGEWNNNKKHGKGTFYYNNGNKFNTIFKYNVLQKRYNVLQGKRTFYYNYLFK